MKTSIWNKNYYVVRNAAWARFRNTWKLTNFLMNESMNELIKCFWNGSSAVNDWFLCLVVQQSEVSCPYLTMVWILDVRVGFSFLHFGWKLVFRCFVNAFEISITSMKRNVGNSWSATSYSVTASGVFEGGTFMTDTIGNNLAYLLCIVKFIFMLFDWL